MKSARDVHIDTARGSTNQVDALVIGSGILKDRLEKNLSTRGLTMVSCRSQRDLDISLSPDFVFWIQESSEERPRESFLNFVRSLQARIIIVSFDHRHSDLLDLCIKNDLDARVVVLHDLYGPHVNNSNISLIWSDIAVGKIIIPENDTISVAPLFIDDAASSLCMAAFSSQTYNQIIDIAGSEDMTILSFSYKLRDAVIRVLGRNPQMEETNKVYYESIPHREKVLARNKAFSMLSWKPETDWKEGIEGLVVGEVGGKKKINIRPETSSPKEVPSFKQTPLHKKNLHLKSIGVAVLLTGILSVFLFSPLVAQALIKAEIERQLVNPTTSSERKVNQLSALGITVTNLSQPILQLFGQIDTTLQMRKLFSDAPREFDAKISLHNLDEKVSLLSESVFGSGNEQPEPLLASLNTAVADVMGKLVSMENSENLRRLVSFGRDLLPLLKWGFGFDQKKTFALVIENSSELRPTGGFISAIGFLTLEKGKLLDLSFIDVYQIDSQLTGKEEPPEPIKKILGESAWLVRDANWDPDGPSSARQMEKMIARSTGRVVDGVVFIPATALKTILSTTGPVTLSTGEEITASNILEHTTFSGDLDIETGKQPNIMISTIQSLRKLSEGPFASKLIKGVLLALQSGDLIVTVNDSSPSLGHFAEKIDGHIEDAECFLQFQTKKCIADSIYIVDANLGVNKVDYFLKRERSLDVQISTDSDTSNTLTLRYRNTSPSSSRPGGNYRGYTRVYIPIDSVVSSIVELTPQGQIEVQSDQGVETGKHVIGFYLDVPYGQETAIKIVYQRSQPLPVVNGVSAYSLLFQKQPGLMNVPTLITIHYPHSLKPLAITPDIKMATDSLLFYFSGDKTDTIAAEFASS